MKRKVLYISIIAAILILGLIIARFSVGGGEDNWVKDDKGIWVKHGNPSINPNYVNLQREGLVCAFTLYKIAKNDGIVFDSQCLGRCGDYAVDIVHNPRIAEDDLQENQCNDVIEKRIVNFIELDKDENIVRVVDSNN